MLNFQRSSYKLGFKVHIKLCAEEKIGTKLIEWKRVNTKHFISATIFVVMMNNEFVFISLLIEIQMDFY